MPHIHELYDFTVSAFILHPSESKILLHKHKKLNMWLQPGGHIELDEDPLQALTRELNEETGLSKNSYIFLLQNKSLKVRGDQQMPTLLNMNVHTFEGSHKHIDSTYLLEAKTTQIQPEGGESTEIEWLTKANIQELFDGGNLLEPTLDICLWIFDNETDLRKSGL